MSDLQLYELEDIAWDELCHSDDHIVPHPSSERTDEPVSQTDSRKKPRHEEKSGDPSTNKYTNQQKEQILPLLSNSSPQMLEKDSTANAVEGAFPSKCENANLEEVSSLPSNACTLDDKNTAAEENFSYPLGPISQADDDLSFFDNNPEDKGTNDLLYYSWPEIENFEDVDRMFRSCDSTFGFGPGNEDDLRWFSSSDAIEGSGDGLMSGFKFPCPTSSSPGALGSTSTSNGSSRPKETNIPNNNSGTENQSFGYNSEKNESLNQSHLSFVDGSITSESKLLPDNKNSMNKKHSKHQNRSEGKRKGGYLESGVTFNYIDSLPEEKKHSTGATRTQVNFTSAGVSQQKQAHVPNFGYLGSSFSYVPSDYSHSNQSVLHPTLPVIKSENKGLMSLSPKDSYASNQVQSKENSPDPSFQVAAMTRNEKKVEQSFHHSGVKVENYRDLVGNSGGFPAELGSSVVQECSSISSGLDEISEEAASFHQLHRVMEQLDLRTKLCIRDSLYRLARSAEQRHRHANLNNDDGANSGSLISKGTNKCTGYMDIETDTNPIDRSIAHLLFHRPSDSSATPGRDSSTLKSPSMIHGSSSSVPVMDEKLISQGEIAPQTDKEVADM